MTSASDTVRPMPTRPRVGLVLGAGGIRGVAHPAIIQVLREADIPIDLVVGASIGAMFGLGLASGLSTDEMVQFAGHATPWELFRFYLGRVRPAQGNPVGRMLLDAGEGRSFADLTLPFGVAVTDMSTRRPRLITEGPVLPAVEASIALPFISRPVPLEHGFCVDGGLVESAPIHFARQMGADVVITAALGDHFRAPHFIRKQPWIHPWLQRVGGTWEQPAPPARIRASWRDQMRFFCGLCADSVSRSVRDQGADIIIRPDFGSLSPNSMFGGRFCFDQGRAAALDALPLIVQATSSTTRA